MKGHLLFGTSHMLPFIVAGGVLLALAVMASGKGAVPADGLLADISNIGIKGLVLFPIIWVVSSVIPLQTNQLLRQR